MQTVTKDEDLSPESVVESVREYCETHNKRFTLPREHVMRVIASNKSPVGAYDILNELKETLDNPKPPTVYRAIDFLSKNHFIHRIESLNAYVICDTDHRHSGAQFMICDTCKSVTETHLCHLPSALEREAQNIGFTPEHWVSELHGTCQDCT